MAFWSQTLQMFIYVSSLVLKSCGMMSWFWRRSEGSDDGRHAGRTHVLLDLHIQQFQHHLHHGSVEVHPEVCFWVGAHDRGQVSHPQDATWNVEIWHILLAFELFVFVWKSVCVGVSGGVGAVDSAGSGQSGWAALHLHPVHQHVPAASSVCGLLQRMLLETCKWEGRGRETVHAEIWI